MATQALLPQHVDAQIANIRIRINEAISHAMLVFLRSSEPTEVKTQLIENIVQPLTALSEDIGHIGDENSFSNNVHKNHGQH